MSFLWEASDETGPVFRTKHLGKNDRSSLGQTLEVDIDFSLR